MKKLTLLLIVLTGIVTGASAQLLPSFQFGIKAGTNLSAVSTSGSAGNNIKSDNRAGFLGGFWAQVGGAGLHFRPEAYYTSKSVTLRDNNGESKATFKSIDVPLLIGTRIGALGVGARFDTGPLVSFAVNKDQSFSGALDRASGLRYKDQNFAWQFGAAVDIQKISIDLRYELGLNKVDNLSDNSKVRINMFNLTLAYRLFSL